MPSAVLEYLPKAAPMKSPVQTVLIISLALAAALSLAAKKKADPLATLNFVVIRDENDKPVRNAAVVMHPVDEAGNQTRNGLELKTSPEGKAMYEGVPYGKLRVQVLAPGFQTYGGDYMVNEPDMDITIKLKRPTKQYSIYEDHPPANEQKKDAAPKKPE
jgi:hypothetical protein